jgi:hypothetical protein
MMSLLSGLRRARLAELTTRLKLTVADRRARNEHIDALNTMVDVGEVLALLTFRELKGGCAALGLEPHARNRSKAVERIQGAFAWGVGPSSATSQPPDPEEQTPMNDSSENQSKTNQALLRLTRRAEAADRATLVETFVDTGALAALLESRDHQVIFGRRGTGKTHALSYLSDRATKQGDVAVYVDMRVIGSTGGLYADEKIPIAERATRLIIDTLTAIHSGLTQIAIERSDLDLATLGTSLDALASAASEVRVASPSGGQSDDNTRHRVHFGSVGQAFSQLSAALGGKRLWVLLDEWSTTPHELQPYLGDLLRRALLPVARTTLKIAAIEHRANFRLHLAQGDYLGVELGADMAADLNLDDFMVFDNDAQRAVSFFKDLFYRHFKSVEREAGVLNGPSSADEFVRFAFTQKTPFEELVTSAEGVPRDAINVIALAAQRAGSDRISITHVRSAAGTWYQRDKEAAVGSNEHASSLLHWIVDKVIAHRRARAFLLRAGKRHPLVDALFDARVLHILKRGVSAHDQPGVRYDVFKIDYGCYVGLLSTQRAPQGLLALDAPSEAASHVEVPPDDYRAIRRAILNLEEFSESTSLV